MNSSRRELERTTDILLDAGSTVPERGDAVARLHALCSQIVGLGEHSTGDDQAGRETRLEHGRALSPRDAARCILDIARTTSFLRGAHDAVAELRARFSSDRINLLYAGSGPFAPLAIPLTTRFSPDELGITVLDAHGFSVDAVRRLTERFGVAASFREIRCCDARDYAFPTEEPLHLVVIETMQKALEHEPQVALTRHLAPQLIAGGILIPERINLTTCLADVGSEFGFVGSDGADKGAAPEPQRRRRILGTILDLTAEGLGVGSPPTASMEIPNAIHALPDLMVRTTVEVFAGHRLDDYDSGITYPTMINHLGRLSPGDRIEFSYEMGPSPGLRVRRSTTP